MTLETSDAQRRAAELLPALIDDLKRLASIPSCAFPGFPPEPVLEMANETVALLHRYGVAEAHLIEVPGGNPIVFADRPAENPGPDTPTVLLYAHYDVQPAPDDQGWTTNPWIPTEKNGRIYGRGIADDKSGIAIHAGALKLLNGRPPVNVKILIEGEEEIGSEHVLGFIADNPDLVRSDAFVIADSGNQEPGQPALTTGLRGLVACRITIRTTDRALHSGLFGGAIPDALITLSKLISTLHDDAGSTVVEGLTSFEWPDADVDAEEMKRDAGLVESAQLIGVGSLASRVWSQPSITIIGMEVPPITGTPNVLVNCASAKLSMRIAPGADPSEELKALTQHLEKHVLWGAELTIEPLEEGAPFLLSESDPVAQIAMDAMTDAWQTPAIRIGVGGSIPMVALLQSINPNAGVLIMGAEDIKNARIHSSDESVDPTEIEHAVIAEALFLDRMAKAQ